MINVLFVCHGNICRSPMAEFILKDLAEKRSISSLLHIESAATSREEIGNPVYPPARRELARHGIVCSGKTARQITAADYDAFDFILCAESFNIRNLRRIIPDDPQGKIRRLLDFTDNPRDISDPWFHDRFDQTYDEILEGCTALLASLGL